MELTDAQSYFANIRKRDSVPDTELKWNSDSLSLNNKIHQAILIDLTNTADEDDIINLENEDSNKVCAVPSSTI